MRVLCNLLMVLFLLSTISLAEDGIYMEQKVTTPPIMGQPARESISKTWSADDRLRQEGDREITIMRFDLGKVWSIMPERNTYFEMTTEEMKQLAKMGMAMLQDPQMKISMKKSGKTKKIKDWNCYEVVIESAMLTQNMWLTNDLPYKKNDFYKVFKNMPEFEELAKAFYNQKEMDGFPVYTETTMNMMGQSFKSSSELIKVSKEKIDASVFELPKGIKKVENPMKQMQRQMQEQE